MTRGKILAIERLTVVDADSNRPILRDISFDLFRGEIFSLVGESGSGKSTLALAIGRLLSPNLAISGSIRFHGEDLLSAEEKILLPIRRRALAFIFQEPMACLNPIMSVGRQIQEALPEWAGTNGRKSGRGWVLALLRDMLFEKPEQIFSSYPHELSGGMQQRVMIAMALAKSPQLMVADEPTSALDVLSQRAVLDRLLSQRRHESLLLITHNLMIARHLSHRIGVIREGQLVEIGPTETVFRNPSHPYTKRLLSTMKWLTLDRRGS